MGQDENRSLMFNPAAVPSNYFLNDSSWDASSWKRSNPWNVEKIPKQFFSNLLISDHPPGPKKQEEVWDGDASGREEKAISLPAWPAFPPLCLCLLSLPWLRRPHLVWAEHSAAPAGPWRTPGQHQGGSPQRGRKHLMGAEQEMEQSCSHSDCKYLGKCEEQWVNPCHHLSRCCVMVNISSSAQKPQPGQVISARFLWAI